MGNFVLRGTNTGFYGPSGQRLQFCAVAREQISGRRMAVYTSEPGVQFYTGNWMGEPRDVEGDAPLTARGNVPLIRRTAFCLETQHFPDSPNKSRFPSTVLGPQGCYESCTVYRFTADGRSTSKRDEEHSGCVSM